MGSMTRPERWFVVLGVSHDTAAFAIAAIRQWWLQVGQKHYSKAKRWLIEADGGRSNGTRNWLWKAGLQALADEFQVIIAVSHTPPGASKWNLIDHRMFSLISENWAGESLESYAVMLKWIQKTRIGKSASLVVLVWIVAVIPPEVRSRRKKRRPFI